MGKQIKLAKLGGRSANQGKGNIDSMAASPARRSFGCKGAWIMSLTPEELVKTTQKPTECLAWAVEMNNRMMSDLLA